MTTFDPVTQLYYSSQWNDESQYVEGSRDTIAVRRGVHNEGSRSDPQKLDLTLRNPDRRFSTQHPSSALYRLLGRSNPIRVHLGTPHVGAADGSDVDATSHVAPSVVAPTDDGLLICCWAAPEPGQTYTVPGSMTATAAAGDARASLRGAKEVITAAGATGTRTATFSVSEDWVAGSVLIHGPTAITTSSISFADGDVLIDGNPGDLWVLHVSLMWNVFDEPTHLLPWDTDGGGWIAVADSGTVGPLGDTHADFMKMRCFVKRVKTTAAAHTVGVPFEGSVLGHIVRIPAAEAGEWDPRVHARTTSMPPRQDTSGNDRFVPLTAAGMIEQLGSSRDEPVQSAMRRWLPRDASTVIAYWPMEDGDTASQAASGAEGEPMSLAGDVDMAASSDFPGSLPLPTLGDGGRIGNGRIPSHATGSEYAVLLMGFPDAGTLTDGGRLMSLDLTGGTVSSVRLRYHTGGGLSLRALDAEGSTLGTIGPSAFAVDSQRIFVQVRLVQNGANIDGRITVWTIAADNLDATAGVFSGSFSSLTLGRSWRISVGGAGLGDGVTVGHLAVGTTELITFGVDRAVIGHASEPAGERVYRLCRDADVPVEIVGDPADTVSMGPQPSGSILELLRQCEDADRGILFEPRGFYGLAYRTGRSLYNQLPTATLDGSDGELAPPWEPDPDGFLVQNDVTVTRPGGSSSRSTQESGPLNVGDPATDVDAVGPRPAAPSVHVGHDSLTEKLADWLLHVGTVDEPRFPVIAVDLAKLQVLDSKTELVATLARLDVGDRLVITSPPGDLPPEDVSVLVVGVDEPELDGFQRRLELTAVPESPYRIAVVAGTSGGGLWLPGASGAYASTPDAAALDITGDLEVGALAYRPDGWLPGSDQTLISKYQTSGDQRSWRLSLDADGGGTPALVGRPFLVWSTDGTIAGAETAFATAVVLSDQVMVWARLDVDDGAGGHTVTFETSETVAGPRTQLGEVYQGVGTTSVHSGSAELAVGSYSGGTAENFGGRVLAAVLRNSAGTTVADPDFTGEAYRTESFDDDQGLTWTVGGDAEVMAEVIDDAANLLQSDTATVDEALDTTETAIDIDCGAGPDWTYEGVSWDVLIGGERMSVIDVGVMSGTFPARKCTITVVRSINGIVKSHAAGTPIHWLDRRFIGL